MRRVAVTATRKPGSGERAAELVAAGPPFDPAAGGFERHAVYIAGDQAVFVFEGGHFEVLVENLARQPHGLSAVGAWQELLDGVPRVVREAYFW
jgi:hypothetical protein